MTTDIYRQKVWLKHYPDELHAKFSRSDQTGLGMWEQAVEQRADAPALRFFDTTFSYGQMDNWADALAVALSELGINKGDRIIIQLQNIPQYLIALYGVWKSGAIAVPLNPMYKTREMAFFLNDCKAKVIISMEDCYSELIGLLDTASLKKILTTSELDLFPKEAKRPEVIAHSVKKKSEKALDLMELVYQYEGRRPPELQLEPSDPGYLTYTSGTTGNPKGAINTHANISFSAQVYQKACALDSNDTVVGVAPFFHVTGSVGHLAVASLLAIPVITFFRFDAAEVLRLIEKWRATMMIAPLTVYVALLNHPDFKARNIDSLTKLLSGGAPVPKAFVDKFESATGHYIHNWYGLTETTSPAVITPVGRRSPVDLDSGALSIGVPVPDTEAKITDVSTAAILPLGEIGELALKGPMVVPGYWGRPEETAYALRDGWLFTGDVAKMDEDGWFYLVDRKKDLINVSGYKVWPRDVEDVLYQHPCVAEVSVVGVPDSYRGETVRAYVTLEGAAEPVSPDQLIAFCKERMAAYKYPRQIVIVDSLPKTASGKILRRRLRELAQEETAKEPF